jgi:hypothetical protein
VCSGGCSPSEADEAIVTADRAAVRRRAAAVREALTLPALLLLEVAAVLGLQRLGQVPALRIPWGDLGRGLGPWLAHSPVENVLGALLRTIALVMAWWLLASTTLYLLASLSRAPALIGGMARLTLPAVRRATDGAVAVALATSLLGAGTTAAAAAAQPPGRVAAGPPPRPPAAVAGTALAARAQAGAIAATGVAAQAGPTSTTRKELAPPGYRPSPAELAPQETTTTQPGTPVYRPAPAGSGPPPPASGGASASTGASTTSTTGATTTTGAATTSTAAPTTRAPTTTAGPQPAPAPTTTARAATTTTAGSTTTRAPGRSGSAAPAPRAPATSGPQAPGYVPSPAGTGPPGSSPPATPPPAARPRIHRVAVGESLWSIARTNLALGTGRSEGELGNREVAAYWVRLLAANRGRLRSGNPDLIYPGEYVRLPVIRR